MKVSMIAAIGEDRGIGLGNKLLWHLPDDLKRFRDITRGHAVIMGRKTYESIGRPLPDRKNIIVTRNKGFTAPGCEVVSSIEEGIKAAGNDSEVFVIGGAEIYSLGMQYCDKLYLTLVDAKLPADVFFPVFDPAAWEVISEEKHSKDERHQYSFIWQVLEKKPA